jgi:transposase
MLDRWNRTKKNERYMRMINPKLPLVIEEYTSSHFTVPELAARHQVSLPTIAKWVRQSGVPRRPRGRRPLAQPTATHQRVIELSAGLNGQEVSKQVGLSRQRVHQILHRWKYLRPGHAGIPIRPAAKPLREKRREVRSQIVSFRLTGQQADRVRATLMTWGLGNRVSSSCACRAVLLAAVGLGRSALPNNGATTSLASQGHPENQGPVPSHDGANHD